MLHHSVLATGGRRGFRAGLILLLFLVASKANGAPLGAGGGGSQKTGRQEEKGTTEDEMVGWHHQLDGHEFEQALEVGDGQKSLACCSP